MLQYLSYRFVPSPDLAASLPAKMPSHFAHLFESQIVRIGPIPDRLPVASGTYEDAAKVIFSQRLQHRLRGQSEEISALGSFENVGRYWQVEKTDEVIWYSADFCAELGDAALGMSSEARSDTQLHQALEYLASEECQDLHYD